MGWNTDRLCVPTTHFQNLATIIVSKFMVPQFLKFPTVPIFLHFVPIFLYSVPILDQVSHFFMDFVPLFDCDRLAPMLVGHAYKVPKIQN